MRICPHFLCLIGRCRGPLRRPHLTVPTVESIGAPLNSPWELLSPPREPLSPPREPLNPPREPLNSPHSRADSQART
eukprot:4148686-Pyramimonas_sp.AAC.1